MQCTGNYPTKIYNANLNVIDQYKKNFKCPIGFSDHTEGSTAAICAVAKGVKIIEKHFTLSKKLKGPDHRMSLEPEELKDYIKSIRDAEVSLGMNEKKIIFSEIENKKKLKKSLVSKTLIKKGQKITKSLISIKRPGNGIRPIEIPKILGKIAKYNIKKNTLLKFKMLK